MKTTATVTTRRARKATPAKKAAKGGMVAASAEKPPPRMPADNVELHRRWKRARAIISEALEADGEHDPQIWERGAYQLWLWLVVEQLVIRRDDVDLGDLSAISKMLHDQRKLSLEELKRCHQATDQSNTKVHSTKLPEHFGDLVRQIYGTNFQGDCAVPGSPEDDGG
jgi:hypothetical protein